MIEFYWNEPFDNGGTSVTSYEVEIVRVSDMTTIRTTVINANRYQYSSSALGFRAGEKYEIRGRANNFITQPSPDRVPPPDPAPWSATSTFYSSVLPQTITGLTYDALSKTGASIRWSLLAGQAEKGYSTTAPSYALEMDDCKNGAFTNILLNTTSATSYTITGLTPGIICRFRMNVGNIIGLSPYSDILTI